MRNGLLKITLFLLALSSVFTIKAQVSLYRCYPQAASSPTPLGYYTFCDIQDPVQTVDGGYIFSYYTRVPIGTFETISGPASSNPYTIKTDSNFVPQWKKPYYSKAIVLPTGGIILVYGNYIEKVTQSGTQVWIKQVPNAYLTLNDGVCYDDKVRIVGSYYYVSVYVGASAQGYSMLIDTTGSFISQSMYTGNPLYSWGGAFVGFSKIERNTQGEFFVCDNNGYGIAANSVSLAKFDSSFNFVWAVGGSSAVKINDIDFMSNGRIFASANIGMGQAGYGANALLKFDQQGNLVAQTRINRSNSRISGLYKKSNGNYVVSDWWAHTFTIGISAPFASVFDSLCTLEIDTAMSFVWNKRWHGGDKLFAGTSFIKNNQLYTPVHNSRQPFLLSSDLNGNNCASQPKAIPLTSGTVALTYFYLTLVAYTVAPISGSINAILLQSYADSCICVPSVTIAPSANLCVGTTATLNASGLGALSWYSSSSGSSFISAGSQYTLSSNTATVRTLYAQDSVCALPYRLPVNIKFNAVPILTLSSTNYSLCNWQTATLSVQGASSYTWSSALNTSSLVITPTTSVSYSVIGSVAPNCADTANINIYLAPSSPTVNISTSINSSLVCGGAVITATATGATNYTWSNGQTTNPTTYTVPILPPNVSTQQNSISVIGADSVCWNTAQTNFSVVNASTMQVVPSSSAICFGNSATLSATGANSYTWNTQAATNSIVVSPTTITVYTVGGTYSYLSYNDCVSTKTVAVNVFQKPTVTVTSDASVICQGLSTALHSFGAFQYTLTNSSGYSFPGIYPHIAVTPSVTETYTIIGSVAPNCSDTATVTINVIPAPTVSISINPSSVICSGETVTISATGAPSYSWNNGQTANSFTLTAMSSTNTITQNTFSLIGYDNSCASTTQISFFVIKTPTVNVSVSNATICQGNSTNILLSGAPTYSWSNGINSNSISAINNTANINISPTGSGAYSVRGSNNNCVSDTATVYITVNPNPTLALILSNPVICVEKTATITVTGANTYTWSNGAHTSSIVVSPTTNTQYSVSATNQYGCKANDMTILNVLPLPTLSINSSTSIICAGSQATLTASGAITYTWTWNNSPHTSSIVVAPTTTTQIYVSGTDTNGCVGSSPPITINVAPKPILQVTNSIVLCTPQPLTLSVSGAYGYWWEWGTNFHATAPNLVVYPNVTTQYSVTGTSQFGCVSSKVVTVTIGCVGIDENEEKGNYLSLRIYPNPTNGIMNIELEMINGNMDMIIYDVLGKTMMNEKLKIENGAAQINVSELKNGIYFITIERDNYPSVVKKFVKE